MNRVLKKRWGRWLWWLTLAFAVIVIWKTFDNLGEIFSFIGWIFSLLTPFVIGFIFAYFLGKPQKRLCAALSKSKHNFFVKYAKNISTFFVYIVFIAFIGVLLSFLLPALLNSIAGFVEKIPQYQESLLKMVTDLSKQSSIIAALGFPKAVESFSIDSLSGLIQMENVGAYFDGIISVSSVITSILLGLLISIYMNLEKENLIRLLKRLLGLFLSSEHIEKMSCTMHRIDRVIYRYFFAQLTDSLIVSVCASIGLALLGVPNALVLGFLFGMFNFIPYFGPLIGMILVLLLTFISSSFFTTLWAFIFLFLLQQLDGNFLNPRILGSSLGFSPFWVIFAVTLGSGLFGVTGMILGVPVFAAVRLIFIDFVHAREEKRDRQL